MQLIKKSTKSHTKSEYVVKYLLNEKITTYQTDNNLSITLYVCDPP